MNIEKIKYAIFDMDGTLVDSMKYWKGLAAEYLHSKGIKDLPVDLNEKIKPMTMTESAAMFIDEFGIKGTVQDVEDEMNHMMDAHYINDVGLKEGVKDYLDNLKRAGVHMCVASATAEELVVKCLSRLGVYEYFEFAVSCDSAGAGKNSPAVYEMATKKLGASRKETVVYEDAFYAVKTAKNAGFYVIGVYDENSRERWDKIKKIADGTICNFNKLKGEIL